MHTYLRHHTLQPQIFETLYEKPFHQGLLSESVRLVMTSQLLPNYVVCSPQALKHGSCLHPKHSHVTCLVSNASIGPSYATTNSEYHCRQSASKGGVWFVLTLVLTYSPIAEFQSTYLVF